MFLHLRRCGVGSIGRDLHTLSISNVSGGRWVKKVVRGVRYMDLVVRIKPVKMGVEATRGRNET
jgi:hypothetical protein